METSHVRRHDRPAAHILAAQAQKHVTHNEALPLPDELMQFSVLDRGQIAPASDRLAGNRSFEPD